MRLLIVHDGSSPGRHAPYGLAEAQGIAVVPAGRDEAIDAVRAGGFDAIVVLPLADTAEQQALCRQLRLAHVSIPVLVVLSRSTVAERVAVLDAGADDCTGHPVEPDELLARLSALDRRRRRRQAAPERA